MAENYELKFSVKEIRQTTGAYEHIVMFDARLLLTVGDPSIKIAYVGPFCDVNAAETPAEAEQWTLEAVESIREAVVEALTPRGLGAVCEISRLRLHSTDFYPRFFKRYMVKHLKKALLDAGLEQEEG